MVVAFMAGNQAEERTSRTSIAHFSSSTRFARGCGKLSASQANRLGAILDKLGAGARQWQIGENQPRRHDYASQPELLRRFGAKEVDQLRRRDCRARDRVR